MSTADPSTPEAASQADEIALRDQQAAQYDEWITRTKGAFFDLLDRSAALRWLKLQPSHAVLDAGCGTGRFTTLIAQRCREVLALDFSVKSIEILQSKAKSLGLPNIRMLNADLTKVELPSACFDRAISIAVIQHIPSAEGRLQALRNVCASLKPGGRALFMVYRWGGALTFKKEYWTDNESGRLFRISFTADEIATLLREAGFRDTRVGGINNFRARGVGRFPFLLRPYVRLDVLLSRTNWSAGRGQHLFAMGIK